MLPTTTVRCVTANGDELATLPIAGTFAHTALTAITGSRTSGIPAEQFARGAFHALAEYELQTDLRSHVICKHLRALDHLALTAVTRAITATITWA